MKERPTIETKRLVLRPFELSDAKDVQLLAGDRAIADTTLNIPHPYEDDMAEEWISTHQPKFETGELSNFAIVLRSSGKLIGAIGLRIVPRFERAELGYWIGKPFWKNGYCTEAAHAVLQYGFAVLKLNRIHASHFTRNPASGRVMQKIGMVHEGRARQHAKRWDMFEDLEFYGILREHWIRSAEQII
jgi:RimJ/RimL family protein N-acetyltransferase